MKKIKALINSENISAILFFSYIFALPYMVSAYKVDNFTNFMNMMVLVLSITLIWGFTGIFSFGQAAFYGIGAYTYGVISLSSTEQNLTVLGVIGAVIVSGMVAAIIGWFIFYGHIDNVFTGLITMCITIALQLVMAQTSTLKICGVTLGGTNGLRGIPAIEVFGIKLTSYTLFYVTAVLVLLIYLFFRRMQHNRLGFTMFGVRESFVRSELFGYNTAKIQMVVFGAGGALAGLAGAMFSAWSGYIVPGAMDLNASTVVVIIAAIAGRKNVTGAIIMTALYQWFNQYLAKQGSQYSQIILGIILIAVVVFLPEGIFPSLFNKIDGLFSRKKIKEQNNS